MFVAVSYKMAPPDAGKPTADATRSTKNREDKGTPASLVILTPDGG